MKKTNYVGILLLTFIINAYADPTLGIMIRNNSSDQVLSLSNHSMEYWWCLSNSDLPNNISGLTAYELIFPYYHGNNCTGEGDNWRIDYDFTYHYTSSTSVFCNIKQSSEQYGWGTPIVTSGGGVTCNINSKLSNPVAYFYFIDVYPPQTK